MDTDIVLQGPLWPKTIETACRYAELDFVKNVIISKATTHPLDSGKHPVHPNVEFVHPQMPENAGPGNMNIQIVTSLAGIARCTSDNVVKMRSDQYITNDSMNMMHRFYEKFSGELVGADYLNGLGPIAPIFVLGLLSTFPYHPQDHVFWGCREDITDMFDLPLSAGPPMTDDPAYWETHLRCPIHLGAHYCARFNETVNTHIADPDTYLIDGSPKRPEAMAIWDTLRDVVMKPFPRIDMWWDKYQSGYWYSEYEPQGEYYHDERWE